MPIDNINNIEEIVKSFQEKYPSFKSLVWCTGEKILFKYKIEVKYESEYCSLAKDIIQRAQPLMQQYSFRKDEAAKGDIDSIFLSEKPETGSRFIIKEIRKDEYVIGYFEQIRGDEMTFLFRMISTQIM